MWDCCTYKIQRMNGFCRFRIWIQFLFAVVRGRAASCRVVYRKSASSSEIHLDQWLYMEKMYIMNSDSSAWYVIFASLRADIYMSSPMINMSYICLGVTVTNSHNFLYLHSYILGCARDERALVFKWISVLFNTLIYYSFKMKNLKTISSDSCLGESRNDLRI